MKKLFRFVASVCALSICAATANADPVSIGGQNFGTITTLNGGLVEFGGSGIPSDATSWSDFTVGNDTLRLGLSATPRFSAPTPTNDGSGTFFVEPGLDSGGVSLWNFSFYAEASEGVDLRNINLELLFDLDPNADTDQSDLGSINLSNFIAVNPGSSTTVSQGSQNATFGFLSTGIPFIVTAPGVSAFDPDFGEYSFALRADGFGSVGINVNVNSVSAPSVAILFSLFAIVAFVSKGRASVL